MARASEDALANLHGQVALTIQEMMVDPDPVERRRGTELALKFLKDNSITTALESSQNTQALVQHIDATTREDLERLMAQTPDD